MCSSSNKNTTVKFCGSHGTIREYLGVILRDGFKGGSGRAGTGVYLWREQRYYVELAYNWARQNYRGLSREDYVVLICRFSVLKSRFLDLETIVMKNAIADLSEKMNTDDSDEKQACKLYDFFITLMERRHKVTFQVIGVRFAPPNRTFYPDYPIRLIGAPYGLVVRDSSVISRDEIEEQNNG
jgi:hypothetical protein